MITAPCVREVSGVEEDLAMLPEDDVPGLLLKLRRAARHACETSRMHLSGGGLVLQDTPALLWQLWNLFVWPHLFDRYLWTPDLLFLLSALGKHPLVPTTCDRGVVFSSAYMHMVNTYHENLERPEGTFEKVSAEEVAAQEEMERTFNIPELASLPRDTCPSCFSRRQVYCGDCNGARMRNAAMLLPERVALPFDILILIDWRETLHKCTGVHAAALCVEGTVSVQRWEKEDSPGDINDNEEIKTCGWARSVRTLDYDRDIILFPSEDSMNFQDFDWSCSLGSVDKCNTNRDRDSIEKELEKHLHIKEEASLSSHGRYRLVLIESTWGGAKSIVSNIQRTRSILQLPALRCATLPSSISGLYWRLQHVGNSAVSSIEALVHAAKAAGFPSNKAEQLLILFYLQRYRLMNRIKSGDGRPPKAVDVRGPWKNNN